MSEPTYTVRSEAHDGHVFIALDDDHEHERFSLPLAACGQIVRQIEAHLYGAARPAPDLIERGLRLADSYAASEIECGGHKVTPSFDGDRRYLLSDDAGYALLRFSQASPLLQEAAQWLIDRGHAVKRTVHPGGEWVRGECVAPDGAEYIERTYEGSL